MRMYGHVMQMFKHSPKEEQAARSMYSKLMKKLGSRAFNAKRWSKLGRIAFVARGNGLN